MCNKDIILYEDLDKIDQAVAKLTNDPIWLSYKEHIENMQFESDPANWCEKIF